MSSIKGLWFIVKMYVKRLVKECLKALWRCLTKKRYVGRYPKVKKGLLIAFLIFNNLGIGYMGWSLLNTKETIIIERVTVPLVSADTQVTASGIEEQQTESSEEVVPQAVREVGEFSAYNAEVGQTDSDPLTMASGKTVYDGALACPIKYEFGTKVKIGDKIYTCEDRMAERYRYTNHFDIFFNSYAEAIEFGRRSLEFEVLS